MMQLQQEMKKNYCSDCKKQFPNTRAYTRHKNRKNPCIVKDIPEDRKNDPRCTFCGHIYKQKCALGAHLRKCKYRPIELTKEEKQEQEIKQLKQQLDEATNKIKDLEKGCVQVANTINNNVINIKVKINNYMTPDMMSVKSVFLDLFEKHVVNTPVEAIPFIWFNPEYPENHAIYLQNKHGECKVYDGIEWKSKNEIDVIKEIRILSYDKFVDYIRRGATQPQFRERFDYKIDCVDNMARNKFDQELMSNEVKTIHDHLVNGRNVIDKKTIG